MGVHIKHDSNVLKFFRRMFPRKNMSTPKSKLKFGRSTTTRHMKLKREAATASFRDNLSYIDYPGHILHSTESKLPIRVSTYFGSQYSIESYVSRLSSSPSSSGSTVYSRFESTSSVGSFGDLIQSPTSTHGFQWDWNVPQHLLSRTTWPGSLILFRYPNWSIALKKSKNDL